MKYVFTPPPKFVDVVMLMDVVFGDFLWAPGYFDLLIKLYPLVPFPPSVYQDFSDYTPTPVLGDR